MFSEEYLGGTASIVADWADCMHGKSEHVLHLTEDMRIDTGPNVATDKQAN
jgi:hypothetical protein